MPNLITWLYEQITFVIDLVVSIIQSLISVTQLAFNLIKDLPLFIKLTTAFSADLPSYLNWLPSSVVSIVTLTIGLVIVYKFFGRT